MPSLNKNRYYLVIQTLIISFAMLISTAAFAIAGTLDVTMQHGVTGGAYKSHVRLLQKQQYTNDKGKTRYRWRKVKDQRTDSQGQTRFDFPDNIGAVDANGIEFVNEFRLAAKSPVSKKLFGSDPFNNSKTQIVFNVGANPFTVTLSNAVTGEALVNKSVEAWQLNADGRSRKIARKKTDASGQVTFELAEVSTRSYFFLAQPYKLPVSSVVLEGSASNSFNFQVGTTAVALIDDPSHQFLSDVTLLAYEVLPDGSFKRYARGIKTNQDGIGYFDLPGLGQKQYVFRARQPYGKDANGKTIRFDYVSQPTIAEAGLTALLIERRDVDGGGAVDAIPKLVSHLLNRITFGASPDLLAHVNEIGTDAYIEEQLYPQNIDDSALQAAVDGWIDAVDDNAESIFNTNHLSYYTLYHAIYSPRQLQEVMAQFWDNHFNTDVGKTRITTAEAKENNLFREHALGKFRDLLAVSAHSPLMLQYLDNVTSKKALPNENYAREIMELHTLGVYGGYTEQDVVDLAKIFTGWRFRKVDDQYEFYFRNSDHDESDKVLLGQQIVSNGQQEGELALDILASSPATAEFICTKLATLFISDTPSEAIVQNCTDTFISTDGDIRELVRLLITSNEFNAAANYHGKFKTPLEFVVGFNRAFGFANPQPNGADTSKRGINNRMNRDLTAMGMPLYRMPAPTGYAEVARKWVNSAQLKTRIRYQNRLLLDQDFNILSRVKEQGLTNADEIVDYFLGLLLDNDFQPEERSIAIDILTQNGAVPYDVPNIDDTDLRSIEMYLLRMTVSTIASFPSQQLQ